MLIQFVEMAVSYTHLDVYKRQYECLDNVRMISKLLSSNGVIIDEISVQGENLETYFENLIGGRKNV